MTYLSHIIADEHFLVTLQILQQYQGISCRQVHTPSLAALQL
jgi:hypothetical protein